VCEVLLKVFGFCFICSAFVVDVQAMVYHLCSLQMVLVHIFKSIRWVIESSRNPNLFVVPKRGCPIFRVKGLYRTVRYVIIVICILLVVGALSPWAWAAVHLPVRLLGRPCMGVLGQPCGCLGGCLGSRAFACAAVHLPVPHIN